MSRSPGSSLHAPGRWAMGLLLLLAPSLLAAGGQNLVDNPSFSKVEAGGKIDRWMIRTRPGRTRFAVENGVLVARRSQRGGLLPDSCYQWINLPPDTKALRLTLEVGVAGAERVLVTLRFKDRNGGPLSSHEAFRLSGTEKPRRRECEILVPEGAWDAEIALVMRGPGVARFDDVALVAIDPSDVRETAQVVRVGGSVWVKWVGQRPEEPIRLLLPLPPATESQSPLVLELWTFPPGRIAGAVFEPSKGTGSLRLSLTSLFDPGELRVFFRARVIVFETPAYRSLPDRLPAGLTRKPPRRLAPWLAAPESPALAPLVEGLDLGGDDLRRLAERVVLVLEHHIREVPDGPSDPVRIAETKTASAAGRAALAAALLRKKGVPARAVALLGIGKGSRLGHGIEAFCRSQGWLRFGLLKSDPRPLPFGAAVLVARAGPEGFRDPLAPVTGPGLASGVGPEAGVGGDGAFRTEVIGSFALPKGSARDMAESLGAAWQKALRRIRLESGRARAAMAAPALRGKAKGAKEDLAGFLGK